MRQDTKLQRYFRNGTLIQLRVFEAVAGHGSFTRAAEKLKMAQPTVSVHVKKLTETVGVPLLEQNGRRLRLTPAGEEVHAACRRLFETFRELDHTLADIRGLEHGALRIATTSSGKYLLSPILAAFVKRYPTLEVALHVAPREDLLKRLAEDADDLYLFGNPPEGEGLAAHAIFSNPLVAFAPADHPLAAKRSIPFERFAREPLLVRERGSGTRLAVERLFGEHGLAPPIRMELGSNETIKEAIIAGIGVSLLYRYALGFEIDRRQLAILDVQGLPRQSTLHFVHAAARPPRLAAQTFVMFAQEQAQRIFAERVASKGRGGRRRAPADAS